MTRVLVYGGRDFWDRAFVERTLSDLAKTEAIDVVIEGDAPNVDRFAGFWARQRDIPNLKFPAEWGRLGRAAGPIRNQRMIDEGKPDLGVAFPGGRGTADMTRRLKAAGIKVMEILY